jgi:Fe-S cluster biogenesis protein NfuA
MSAAVSSEFQIRLERLDRLLNETGRAGDPAAEARIREIAQAILQLHGMGLERLLEIVAETASAGPRLLEALAADSVVSGLLLLHGLHPHDLETQVAQALDGVKPYLQSHGGSIELIDLSEGIVRVRFQGSCDGCPSSALTMKQTIERAIQEAAPDVAGIELVGIGGPAADAESSQARLALPILQ